jgi:hypothetical protein
MMLSGHSSGIMGSDIQNINSSLTPANIRASARREIGMTADMSSGGYIVRA